MLVNIWHKLSNIGISGDISSSESRYILLTNRFSLIASLICVGNYVLLFILYNTGLFFGPENLALLSAMLFLTVLLSNNQGLYLLSKLIISWLPVVLLLGISIYEKKQHFTYVTVQDFYSYRFFLLVISIIPILINNTKRIKFLVFSLIPGFIGTVFFGIIHQALGIGVNQMGFGYHDSGLIIFDTVVALAYLTIIGFLLNQRIVFDRHEAELQIQREKLLGKNKELTHKNSYINEQNHEITAQTDSLKDANDALFEAKQIIETQKQLLEDQNKNLEAQVLEKTKDLSRVNEELIINNNEMRQFSHTLSHNLKSPVATFQGLLNLVEENDLNDTNIELLKYLNQSVDQMQMVFSDLNEILELRNNLYTSTNHVDIQKQIDSLHSHFYPELRRNNINFSFNCNGNKSIETNEKKLNGILFQLICNSIKFRSNKRDPEIILNLNGNDEYHSIKIRDNGLGIDLEKYRNKLFYPYQKFHDGVAGKGLGLYLVKLQAESLGGSVKVSSKLDEFTEVEVRLKK